MLYLEDYLEMIEHLPQELKDRFTEIRELDLQVQNATDKLEDRVKVFFAGARKQKTLERDTEFESIRSEYYKVLEDADEKVHQANQMYELVEKYLRKLDQELYKFKMELEADNAGITEVLEKRSLEMDAPHQPGIISGLDRVGDYLSQKENRYMSLIKSEKKSERKNSHDKLAALHLLSSQSSSGIGLGGHSSSTGGTIIPGGAVPPLAYSLNHMGAGGNAIAAAASQAIAATQQMQQGRRTASLKASYDAVNLGIHPAEFSVGRELLSSNTELHQAAQQALAATGCATGEQKRNKRKSHHTQNQELMPLPTDELMDESVLVMDTTEPADWTAFVDPSEPRYCVCNEVSYGDMVACDNSDCPIEWFHYGCVGITATPKGKWYCPQCAASMKRRGRR